MSEDTHQKPIEGFVTLHIPCRSSYLRIVRQSVADLCIHAGLSEFKAAELEMAVDEACALIIDSNSEVNTNVDSQQQGLRLNLIRHRKSLVMELYDFGPPLDFHEILVPENIGNGSDTGELGNYVISRLVDDVQYQSDDNGGNCLRLTKQLL